MNDIMILVHVMDVLIGLLADRGDLFEVEKEYFMNLLDKIRSDEKGESDE